jgi:hypothetical protein
VKNLAIGFIGVALTLALAAPSWAQGRVTNAPTATTVSLTAMAGKDACASRHKTHSTRRSSGASSDNQANQLNAQELARLQAGGAPAPAPMPMGR